MLRQLRVLALQCKGQMWPFPDGAQDCGGKLFGLKL